MAYSRAYASNYDLIDWSDFRPSLNVKVDDRTGRSSGPAVMPDIAPFVSPVDRSLITSRSQLREHEKRFQVKQVGSDLKPADYAARPQASNDKALERAYRIALQKSGLQ